MMDNKPVVAKARLVPPRGYERSMGIVVDVCPYCRQTHRHGFSEETSPGVWGMREADCMKGQYLLVDGDKATSE